MDELRVPPQNLDAEQSVIGSILSLNDAIDEVAGFLEPSHFYSEKHQRLYATILRMRNAGSRGIDALTLSEELERSGKLAEAGGARYILEVLDKVPHAAHVKYYAEIVRDKAVRRGLINVCTEALREAYGGSAATTDLVARSQAGILSIDAGINDREPSDIGELLIEALAELGNPQRMRTVTSTFQRMDLLCGGFPIGGLTIIGARPSSGKTALICSIAVRLGEAGVPVLFISYEQRRIEIAERLVAIYAMTDFYRMSHGLTQRAENEQIVEYASRINKAPVYIDDTQRPQSRLLAMIRGMVRRRGIKIVFVDYLQLVPPDDSRLNREQQVSGVSRACKQIAVELNIAVVVLSQFNRQMDIQQRKPRLSDFRESGALEQDADVAWLLYRPNADTLDSVNRPDDHGIVIVAKQRNGPRGEVPLEWVPPSMAFRDVFDSQRASYLLNPKSSAPISSETAAAVEKW